jgi:WD40 repeat protein
VRHERQNGRSVKTVLLVVALVGCAAAGLVALSAGGAGALHRAASSGAPAPGAQGAGGSHHAHGSRPVNVHPPTISGTAQVGGQLAASPGSWSPAPTSYRYKWKRCKPGGHCRTIRGATASTYAVVATDIGSTLRVWVSAFIGARHSKPVPSSSSAIVTGAGGVRHLEYVFNDGPVSVYDIDNGFKLVESFTLPGTNQGVRGVAVPPASPMMFVAFGGDGGSQGTGSVLAYDLVTKKVVWSVNLTTGIDSLAVSNDGKLLYVPDGALSPDGNWYILNAANGKVVGKIETPGPGPHNGVMSADGKILQLGDRSYSKLPLYNTQTGKLEGEEGPFVNGVRPNTINGADSVSFTTATEFDGFQVGSITKPGKPVLYTESFGACSGPFNTCSHGVSLSPDNRQLAVIDTVGKAVQLWDVHGVAEGVAPAHLATVPVAGLAGNEQGCAYACPREGWVQHSLDGRYVFVGDSGDVINTATRKVVAKIANLLNTRIFDEVEWSGGVPVASSGRQGIGH